MKVALGGERVGSGNKMNLHLRNYERSTHNLSQSFKSSMGVGILYPFLCIPTMRGDKFDIDLSAGVRTIPSMGAMFGTYKLQLDVYQCPMRLYTGILHNNPYELGLNMDKVYFPQFWAGKYREHYAGQYEKVEFSTSSLLHYLGLSGVGVTKQQQTRRYFNAIPVLAYYDIFKNYYSNKQEKNAYVLDATQNDDYISQITNAYYYDPEQQDWSITGQYTQNLEIANILQSGEITIEFEGENLKIENFRFLFNNGEPEHEGGIGHWYDYATANAENLISDEDFTDEGAQFIVTPLLRDDYSYLQVQYVGEHIPSRDNLAMFAYPLKNIDKMRAELLSWHEMGAPYVINEFDKYPYAAVCENDYANAKNINNNTLQGLCIKTYQSDIFNNWLSTEYIDGVNGIAEITRVNTEGGGFKIDALNFSEKMYNLLNRIVVSGGTYEDWQDVVYENTPKRHLESPMYLGGLSQEIIFEEIVNTADTSFGEDTGKPLGAIGGRGTSRHRKGGHIRVKCDEASFIIGIISITPRVDYSQGNEFYFTDLLTMDDLHKPALDGIGFQDLIGERMAYFDTITNELGVVQRHVIGKLPAWIEYMTAVDKVHGNMADGDVSYMVLNRNYEFDDVNVGILDATTYIDPAKYNYAFAYTERDSQNFWVQVQSNIIARRKMSAKQIPNI